MMKKLIFRKKNYIIYNLACLKMMQSWKIVEKFDQCNNSAK